MHSMQITHIWGEVQLWRATWDSYVRSPTFIAQEASNDRFTIQNLFCHLQANGKWLTILKSLKEKRKQTRMLLRANTSHKKGHSLCGVHLGLLPQTSPGDLFLLSSSLFSLPFRVRLLPWVGLGLFLYHYLYLFLPCLHVQFVEDMCTSRIH